MKKILRREKKKETKYSTETSSSSEEEEEDTIIYMDTDDEPYDVDSDLEEADIKSITDVDTESDREPQDIKREKNRLTQHKGTNLRKISVSDEEKIVNYIDINTNDDIPAAQNKIQPELLAAEDTMSLDEDQESKVETVTVAQIHTEKPPIRRSPHLKTTKTSMLDEEQNKVYNSSSRNNRDTNIDLDVIEPLASIDNIDINRLPIVSDSFIIDDTDVASDFSFSLIDVSKTSQHEANIQSRKRACDENKTDNICAKKRLKTKTRNCMKRKKTTTKNDREKKSEKPVLKCVGCEEDLISDAEDDDEKNIGCDKCPRWFHMRCTTKKGMSYVDVASQEFICHVCFV
ncbi:uncharacterized protein LOC121735833 [Aricia agestis]|uniref:uncharacterized protein LOC121735833 n=1 Tax=Aricia agestis TaxID=91739 RepID=UPI001C209800|nr:uncharacterized protein LOC121735833 [Aricia agestis]